jgi:[ribosomal protein S18]-alanine N-acetyltransferase
MPDFPAVWLRLMAEPGPVSVSITPASLTDSPSLAELHQQCWPRPWDEVTFANMISGPLTHVLVARTLESSKAIAGFIIAQFIEPESEILMVATSPTLRRNGIGGKLLDALLDRLGQFGPPLCFLEVADNNLPAQRLYMSRGFENVGRRKAYYPPENQGSDPIDALVLRLGQDR